MTMRLLPSAVLPWSVLALALVACQSPAERAAAPILEKNASARGGLEAWRGLKSMILAGKLDAGRPRDPVKLAQAWLRPRSDFKAQVRKTLAHGQAVEEAVKPLQLPFVMELKRPGKKRLELTFQGQIALQVFDGTRGWKVRPFLGRHEVEPYTAEEQRQAALDADLDGPLLGAAARGAKVELVGTEKVEGRDAHKLKVTAKDGQERLVWVDAETFLDVRVDGTRRMDGKPRRVWTTFRDYRPVEGLLIPHLLETAVEGVRDSERIVVERVALDPDLDDGRFARPD